MEPASDNLDLSDTTLDFKFNSEFARSLSTDITKYDSEFSNETESINTSKDDEVFLVETNSFFIENVNKSDEDKEKQLWNQSNKKTKRQSTESKLIDSSDAEILRLRKECQNLLEENRRLYSNNYTHQQCTVQNNRIEMLEWQLNQAEKKNEMCIKLLREVAHYLEKCNTKFESSQQQQQQHSNEKMIERSKSISHISSDKYICNNRTISNTPNRSRTHSISNLSHSVSTKFFSDLSFKDFTWRLSPKHKFEGNSSTISEIDDDVYSEPPIAAPDDMETEKLSKEAYRILRLIRNTINSMMTINNTSTADNSTLINDETKMSFSEIKSSGHLTIPTSEKCDKHPKNSSGSRFSALENESGFSSMSSFIIPSLNEIGLPPNPAMRKEVTFDERPNENIETFNVLWV